ncbi:saccharopine dehydrogenase [Nitzschia inconspicua]|uniref:Saccharopine dehydrogenase n=1 Tax=Nitzschia inconspicua TaxID=303405 RepID=A0A9K3PFA6_9STRA|nr:saccharopine dehydrogenase [Nitzschia inconspicua]
MLHVLLSSSSRQSNKSFGTVLYSRQTRNLFRGRFLSKFSISSFSRTQSSPPLQPVVTLGLLRENYDKWERRAPLTPSQCHDFLLRYPQSKILVQPSSHRIFANTAYERAGATVQEDLSAAHILLGVKRPRSFDNLPSEKTYMFFSHVIKGQPENMGLLQDILDRKIQLIDYEKIVVVEPTTGKEQRLVAFGRFAGLAGTIDSFHILGQRLLRQSWSTPFLNVPPSIYHSNLEEAKRAVRQMGECIAKEGLPEEMPPIVYGMTGGPRGNVYQGVREIFDLLPHEMVAVEDLPQIYEEPSSRRYKIYGVAPEMKDLYARLDQDNDSIFDRRDFFENSQMYRSQFATKIAPYLSVLINSIFWDHRFPRLLTKQEIKDLYRSGNERLMVVSDISCDIGGSVEFLERSTTIDRPVFQYDPIIGKEVADTILDYGVSVSGVDILPTELPKESSQHFGKALQQVIPDLVQAVVGTDNETAEQHVDPDKLSSPLSKALITTHEGNLAYDFRYLEPIMKRTSRASRIVDEDARTMILSLEGHLFDSGLINQVLDVFELDHCAFEFLDCNVRYRGKGEDPIKSSALLKITTDDENVDLEKVEQKVGALVNAIVTADATMNRLDRRQSQTAYVEDNKQKTVLLLGSGRVSKSVVDYLGHNKHRNIVVASDDKTEAKEIAALAHHFRHVHMDIVNDQRRVHSLIKDSDVVISLLPAPMHPQVAEMCIDSKTDMVTASYESKEMRNLKSRIESSGIKILNEVGLDPGLDHMSAMKMIDEIKDRGGHVTSFSSVCGGLPAPEAADNPLRYKFSWSPRGVIAASQNDAHYLWEGRYVQVSGNELLANAAPFVEAWPELHLECLPNRDSLHYKSTYGLDDASTIFRGTLRYSGFSSLMHVFKTMGFFDSSIAIGNIHSWDDVLKTLNDARGGFATIEDFILACANDNHDESVRVKECLEWLHMTGSEKIKKSTNDCSIVDIFCHRLEERLKFEPTERDMVCMHHTIGAKYEDGTIEKHFSSLQAFGTEATMTAMCKTVGYPAAIAADLVLSGLEGKTGLLLPTSKDIYLPTLAICEKEGIVFEEHVKIEQQGITDLNAAK